MKLRNWTAVRSGGTITVAGDNAETRKLDKITNVESIGPPPHLTDQFVIATDKDGETHELWIG